VEVTDRLEAAVNGESLRRKDSDMSIFRRQRKSTVALHEVTVIRDRVKAIRDQLGRRDVELTDLFSLLSEDERRVYWSQSESQTSPQ
jgi:hypothetical protein